MIIGLTGTFGAGKGEISRILVNLKYVHHSCSDVLREELRKQGVEETIPNLAALGNRIREEHGAGELPRRLIKIIRDKGEGKAIVDSIRSVGEVEELRKERDFVLFSVDAPVRIRYERIKSRGRAGDNVDFEEFSEQEGKQMNGQGSNQNLKKCMEMADYSIMNDGTIEDLEKKVNEILKKVGE